MKRNGINKRIFALDKAERPIEIPARAIFLYEGLSSILKRRNIERVFRNVVKPSISKTPSWI